MSLRRAHRTPGPARPGAHRARRPLRRVAWVGGVALGVALSSTQSAAFWTATTTPGSAGGASSTTVPRAATPQVTTTDRTGVTVSWSATSLGDGTAATGYTLRRFNASGVAQTITAGCAGTVTATSCTETDLPDGVWTYAVTPRYASWSGQESQRSASVRTDGTPPVNDISLSQTSGGVVKNGDTIYYRGAAAGSFRLSNALRDPGGSGPDSSVTGTLSGATAGWSHNPSSVGTPTGGPYVSDPFSWNAGSSGSLNVGVAGLDVAGNTAATTLSIVVDNDPPTGGAISYPSGFVTTSTVPVTLGAISDSGSGLGAASRYLQRRTGTLNGNQCAMTPWDDTYRANPTAAFEEPVAPGACFQFRYAFTDSVGNLRTTEGNLGARRSYADVVRGTSGLQSYYRMDDTNNTILNAQGTGNGTYVGGPTRGQAGALGSGGGTSVFFDGVDDYGRVTRSIGDAFSIEFWFRSNQNPAVNGDANQWYSGVGLVDAEVAGAANDFGVTLMNGGRIGAGTGNPDRTIRSGTGYNDNAWHHVVMTRNGGTVVLYVDGVSVGSFANGNAAALTAPANIDFGRLQTGINHFRGNLDEIALYNTALTAGTVQAHYAAGMP